MELAVKECGGLGNQLFQYAALLFYGKHYGAAVRIVAEPAANPQSFGYPRPCLLAHYLLSAPLRQRSFFERLLLAERKWLRRAVAPLLKVLRVQVVTQEFTRRYLPMPELPLVSHAKTVYLEGFWQTHAMVAAIESQLRREFTLREPATGENLQVLQQIQATKNPVSLHIRHGDTVVPEVGRMSLPKRYYAGAVASLREQLGDLTLFVFSDEIAFARKYLPWPEGTVFVNHNDDFSAHEDLRLMAACHHHIMANSTFSWWGAWLNPRPDKIVIAPKQWEVHAESYFPALMANTWTLVDVSSAN